ncbi:calpain-10 isoform X2 [Gouania willdenowi]|uniref:Calpain catalytic domain-containing protein n=1 Tax=Gouania willdenowi TaxID=441366 RepID=A0A8C5GHP7_GOUWI|nr:calpain-10 isoform X2 [Gouania willdenowi]
MKETTAESGASALFEDPDFPCEVTSLFCDCSTPIAKLEEDITWHRPQVICPSPALFPGNINVGHARQGLLGDCWFLCACSFLLKNKKLLNKVLPPDQPQWGDSRYKGSFVFCFWRHGHWTEVTVDDRLPCIDMNLCFSRCHSPGAFWVALLEKAYAKLHGSYERLWAGQVSEALVDLTGGLAERWSLAEFTSEQELLVEQDGDHIRRIRPDLSCLYAVKEDCALSCSTLTATEAAGEQVSYHALTVMEWLDVKVASGGELRLLRLRNPWGRSCWGGAWIQGGAGWTSVDPVCAADLQARATDGEFWLDEDEFVSQFDDVTVGYPISEEGHLKSIYTGAELPHMHQLPGGWVMGHSAGGSRNSSSYSSNPKFWLKVEERGEVLVSLLQYSTRRNTQKSTKVRPEHRKNTQHQHHQAIALHMWKVEKKRFSLSRMLKKPSCASTHCHAYQREVVLCRQLEPGYYLLIPSTFQPGAEAHFLIRVFSSSPTSFRAVKSSAPSLPLTADSEWETSYFRGSWEKGTTAGGSRNFHSHWENPCFHFSLCEDPVTSSSGVNVKINLHQSQPDTDLHPIGFHVYNIPAAPPSKQISARDQDPVASCVPHCYMQEVSLSCSLPPGAYTIVPSTYQPDCVAEFTLSLAHRIHRKVVKSQERLNKSLQEVSHVSLMQS